MSSIREVNDNIYKEKESASNPTTSKSSKTKWTSEHLADCQEILKQNDQTDHHAPLFVTTKADPPFQMSIHNPKEDVVSKNIHDNGCWECHHLQQMLSALSLHPNSYFLDIGGNIGMWTLAAANAQFETFTIEPSRENYSRICETVNKNGFHDRVHLMTVAATSTPQVFQLNVPSGNKGGTQVKEVKPDENGADGASSINSPNTIQGVVIDSLNLPTDRPVVMKIDVEGHELEALSGALKFMDQTNIVYAMMELRTGNLRGKSQEWTNVFEILSSKGLVPFRIDDTEKGTQLDPKNLNAWQHHKHPKVMYFDVIWKKVAD